MRSTVTLDPGGPYFLQRQLARILPDTVAALEGHLRERVPPTTVRLVKAGGFGDGLLEAVGGHPTADETARAWKYQRRTARDKAGMTLPTHRGRVLVMLHTPVVRDEQQLQLTLTHELVHAVQFGRPGIADRVLTAHRHDLGLGEQSARWLADYDRLVTAHEAEACRLEDLLSA
jgi:hypothetical protein